MADGRYKRTAPDDVREVHANIARIYGRGREIAYLEPDLIGEHHVATVTDRHLLDGCFAWTATLPAAERSPRYRDLLTVLQRASQPEHGAEVTAKAAALLDHVITQHLDVGAAELVAVCADTPGAGAQRLAAGAPGLSEPSLLAVDQHLRLQAVALLHASLAVAQRLVELARNGAPHALARRLNTLGIRYSNLKRLDEALAASAEAVELYRLLYGREPGVYGPDLAMSLNNLGNRYSGLKRLDEALAASAESVDIYRMLYGREPGVYGPDLAMSLNNLGMMYSNLKRLDEALAASSESVDIRRLLYGREPGVYGPDLAMSLSVLSDALRAKGRSAAGAAATREGMLAILPALRRRPAIYAELASMLARDHIEACEEAGQQPDDIVLDQINAVLPEPTDGDA